MPDTFVGRHLNSVSTRPNNYTLADGFPALTLSVLFSAVLCVVILRYFQPLPDEDAYISFVYSRSLSLGLGPTYYGLRVEGFSNPLSVFGAATIASSIGKIKPLCTCPH